MGCDKASLPFAGETMLARVVRLVSEVIPPEQIVCVAAKEQELPELPSAVRTVCDRAPDRGPLEGLATGLAAAEEFSDRAFVTTCDAPLLVTAFVTELFRLLGDYDAAVPRIQSSQSSEQWYPLSAVYRPSVLATADERLKNHQRRVIDFVEAINVREVTAAELREVDPELFSLRNCNTMREYEALLATHERH